MIDLSGGTAKEALAGGPGVATLGSWLLEAATAGKAKFAADLLATLDGLPIGMKALRLAGIGKTVSTVLVLQASRSASWHCTADKHAEKGHPGAMRRVVHATAANTNGPNSWRTWDDNAASVTIAQLAMICKSSLRPLHHNTTHLKAAEGWSVM